MNEEKKYDLEERTALFGESIVVLCKDVKQDAVTRPLISQLVRSGTSVGANYREANAASSKKDFRNKIYICKKEAQETEHWFRMIRKVISGHKNELQALEKECHELVLIFGKIVSTLRNS